MHQHFLDQHFALVVRFLAQTLRAADWAKTHEGEVRTILQQETRAGSAGVAAAYRDDFHLTLAPDLSDERVSLFKRQKNFQLAHGFLDRDVDIDAWLDRRPLQRAHALLEDMTAVV